MFQVAPPPPPQKKINQKEIGETGVFARSYRRFLNSFIFTFASTLKLIYKLLDFPLSLQPNFLTGFVIERMMASELIQLSAVSPTQHTYKGFACLWFFVCWSGRRISNNGLNYYTL